MSNFLNSDNLQADFDITGVALYEPASKRVVQKWQAKLGNGTQKQTLIKGHDLLESIVEASRIVESLQEAIDNAIVVYEKGPIKEDE